MSIEAMTWALSIRVGNSTRKLVLVGIANHAHKNGKNAWCGVQTLAEYADCDDRTVRRHQGALLEDGFIREGNQNAIDPDVDPRYRPIVYDVAMSMETVQQWRAEYAAGQRGEVRAARAENGSKGGRKTAEKRRAANLSPLDVSPESSDVSPDVSPEPGVSPDTSVSQTSSSPLFSLSPSSFSEQNVADAPAKKSERGSRIDQNWIPDVELREWAKASFQGMDLRAEHLRFIDYWLGVPGAKGRKVDWPATWRNWMRRAWENHTDRERRANRPAATGTDGRVTGWLDVAQRLHEGENGSGPAAIGGAQ